MKQALTPQKKMALESAFKLYVQKTDLQGSKQWKKRLSSVNKHLAALPQSPATTALLEENSTQDKSQATKAQMCS